MGGDSAGPGYWSAVTFDDVRAVSRNPVLYAEMTGAQHAFEVFPSYRTARVIEGVERFLHSVRTGKRDVAGELVE